MKDLTKGKPSTLILAFALPIFFANLLQLTYSLVDTRIVGTFLGEDALAAVGATTTLSNLVIFTADLKYTECSVRSDGNGKKLYFRDHCRACGDISL